MKNILIVAFLAIAINLSAQEETKKDTAWKFGGITSLNLTQVYLKNWAAGGQQSVAFTSLVNLRANYKKGNKSWVNRLDATYGMASQGGNELQKTDDRLDLLSKYGIKATDDWYYTALATFRSQFAPGYNLPDDSTIISEFMSPGYVTLSLGMDYKPNETFSAYLSPATAKMTFVLNQDLADAGAFGVEAAEFDDRGRKIKDGENLLFEVGAYANFMVVAQLMENVKLQSRLELFSSYTQDPTNIDIFWENILAMRVNKYLTANITTTLIYDDDIDIVETKSDGTEKLDNNGNVIVGPRTQFKEVFSLGFQYTFGKLPQKK